MNQAEASEPRTAVAREADGHWRIGGVYVGRKISETLFAEQVASCRHVIRSNAQDVGFAKRLGEVFGGSGDYQSCLMRGDLVGVAPSLLRAAQLLVAAKID